MFMLRIAETSVPGVFQLELERLAKCGVRTKYEKETICLAKFRVKTIFFGQMWVSELHYLAKSGIKVILLAKCWVRTIFNYQMSNKNYVLLLWG